MEYKTYRDQIVVSLPITTPTGKIRVKRPIPGHGANPVACRTVHMEQNDYLEWQISYDTASASDPSVVPSVILNKSQGTRYGFELVRLLVDSCEIGILPNDRFSALLQLVNTPLDAGIEELEQIRREEDLQANTIATPFGFTRHHLHVPNYLRVTPFYSVELKIAHKQRAVGNQAMIFVNLPLIRCASQNNQPLIGRTANKLEKVNYAIEVSNVDLIYDTIVAFAVASVAHRNDLQLIFAELAI